MKFVELTSNANINNGERFVLNLEQVVTFQPGDSGGTWFYCIDKPDEPVKVKEEYTYLKNAMNFPF